MSELSLFGKCIVEFTGSFLLGCVASFRPNPATICATLVCVIYMGFELSGGHYNPALTLTFVMRGLTTIPEFVAYIPTQFFGYISGVSIGRAISGLEKVRFRRGVEHSLGQAISGEILFTFALCYCLLMIALRSNSKFNPVFGFAVVAIAFAAFNCIGPISGASLNPAIAMAFAVANRGDFSYALLVSVGNIAGALLAQVLFYVTTPEELKALPWKWVQKSDQPEIETQSYKTEP